MTRRSSLRALAREIYREMTARKAAKSELSVPAPSLTLPRTRGREQKAQREGESLHRKSARAL